jgi:tRNA threonylcarbamoyladenosine biosynthesis protein TsaB
MIVLAIDTAGIGCYAALYDSETETVLGAAGADIGRGHAEQLIDFVDQALEAAGLAMSAVERIAVTVGPGSFTGIRVGVAAARGLALALSVPVVGVSTFLALAGDRMGVGSLLVAMDAKRDEIYWQLFSAEGAELSPPTVGPLAEASAIAAGHDGDVAGSAAPLLRDGAPPQTDGVSIAAVARLGAALDPTAHPAKPLYLRGPDVKPQAGFAVRRA